MDYRNNFQVSDDGILTVNKGSFKGLKFQFDFDYCRVLFGRTVDVALDVSDGFTLDRLLNLLLSHNIIRPEELGNRYKNGHFLTP
jgi:hypothetical protein